MFSVACSVGFASLQSQLFVPLHLCIDSHLCRCIVQRLCVAVFMHPCITALCGCHYASLHSGFVWLSLCVLAWTLGGSPTLSPGMDAGRVCQRALQGRKANQAYTSFHGERGLGFRQGCRDRTPKGFMQGRIQVVEQSRCRTHRQQTTTIAQMQSQQSIHSPSPRGRGLGLGI